MNNVRRLLGGGSSSSNNNSESTATTVSPLVISGKPSWSPSSPSVDSQPHLESINTTPSLFLRKKQSRDETDSSFRPSHSVKHSLTSPTNSQPSTQFSFPRKGSMASLTSPLSGPSSPRPKRLSVRKPINLTEEERKQGLLLSDRKNDLLISLLASEALVDCRDFEILGSEEVDELKKEQQVLNSRLEAMKKKLVLEIKIRDAALSLAKVNSTHKKVSKQTDEQLDAANRRVETAQKEFWRVSERFSEVQKRILEHDASVLAHSLQNMEKKVNGDVTANGHSDEVESPSTGSHTPNRSLELFSPTLSSATSLSSSSRSRFDGAHLFAGHADALVPTSRRTPTAAEITALEEKLKAATETLNAANKAQAKMTKELASLQRDKQLLELEKQEVETTMGLDLQSAEETISALERELPKLESLDSQLQVLRESQRGWETEKAQLVGERDDLKSKLEESERRNGQNAGAEALLAGAREKSRQELLMKDAEIQQIKDNWNADRSEWTRLRTQLEDEKMEDLARLQEENERLRAEDALALERATVELEGGLKLMQAMMAKHKVVSYAREPTLQALVSSTDTHLDSVAAKLTTLTNDAEECKSALRKLEEDVRSGLDKREVLARDLEDARRDREEARSQVRTLETRLTERSAILTTPASAVELPADSQKIISILQPLWAILPSPEARAAKGGSQRQFRTGSTNSAPGTPSKAGNTSMSELDVRTLKSLYDNRAPDHQSLNYSAFSIDGFAQRVRALVADDRALIERLLRFAQAHDMLKKNAERAQKMVLESSAAMETYQKQVKALEDRIAILSSGEQSGINSQIEQLQAIIERVTTEKLEIETRAAEQAKTFEQLTEANSTLSARAVALAEEVKNAPERVRILMEAQLTECRNALKKAEDEAGEMRMSEQTQRIALMDELNLMQTENGNLRAQLRAVKK